MKDTRLLSTILDVFFSKLISTEKSSRSKGIEWQTQPEMQLDLTPTNEKGFGNCGWVLVESQWKFGR